jgi:hypothetical protein
MQDAKKICAAIARVRLLKYNILKYCEITDYMSI